MTQSQAVKKAIENLGGIAPLSGIYPAALGIEGCEWGTKTPYASIRRIVRHTKGIFVVRKGLYALEDFRDRLARDGITEITEANRDSEETRQFSHTYFQGLLVKIGNMKHFGTFVPNQDRNRMFLKEKTLGELRSLDDMPQYSYPVFVKRSSTIDVIWFNANSMPHSFFEVEHSTDIQNSLLKFCDLQDFNTRMVIVADGSRKDEYLRKMEERAFKDLSDNHRVDFLSYDSLGKQYEKLYEETCQPFIL